MSKYITVYEAISNIIHHEQMLEAKKIKHAFREYRRFGPRAFRLSIQIWLVKTEDTPYRVSYKMVSTLPGFRWHMTTSIERRSLTEAEKASIERDAQDAYQRARRDPWAFCNAS